MTLGRKVSLATVFFGIILTVGALAVLRVTILPAFEELEVRSAEKERARILASDSASFDALVAFNENYSAQGLIYDAVFYDDVDAIDRALNADLWTDDTVHLVLLYGPDGRLLYGWGRDRFGGIAVEPGKLMPFDPVTLTADVNDNLRDARGFLMVSGNLMRIVSRPLSHTARRAESGGFLVTGKYLADDDLNRLARNVSGTVAIEFFQDREVEAPVSTDFTIELSADLVTVRQPVLDIFGTPVGDLIIETDRTITAAGRDSIMRAVTVIACGIVAMLLAGLAFLNNQIVSPVGALTNIMQRMRSTGNLNIEADSRRKDEIGLLAREFKELVTKLDLARHDLEEARDEAVAYALSKSEFLARMSHEIRTPMNGVVGMTELLKNTELTEHQSRCVRTIGESGSTLLSLINDVLDFSKIDAGKMTMESADVNLRELLEETVEGFAESAGRKGLELVSIVPADMNAIVQTDPTRLRQVLVNLMGNALKFTSEGEVVLQVSAEQLGDDLLASFAVKDTGVGIQEDARESIFEAFSQEDNSTTRMYGGTGLGLAISHQIVEQMGGKLELDSTVGEGSTFSFSLVLPLVRKVGGRNTLMKDRRVVVVEDNASARDALVGLLKHLGADVECIGGLLELSGVIKERPTDLVIVDGRQRLLEGAGNLRDIMSGDDAPALIFASPITDMLEGGELGLWSATACITKPVRLGDLESALLAAAGGGDQVPQEDQPDSVDVTKLEGRILLAEDNAVNQMVAIGILQHLGLETVVANNGQEAVDMFITDDFDAILMDCQMPVLDGFKATQAIREWESRHKKPRMPVIALTANAMATDRQLCIYAGMDDYLAKPFKPEELRTILEAWLSGSGKRESA